MLDMLLDIRTRSGNDLFKKQLCKLPTQVVEILEAKVNDMKRILITVVSLLFIAGCSRPPNAVLFNFEPFKMFRIPPNTRVEWDDMILAELPKELQNRPTTRDVPIIKGEIVGDYRETETWGWFVDDEIMQKVYNIKAEEDLRMTWTDKLWKGLGL